MVVEMRAERKRSAVVVGFMANGVWRIGAWWEGEWVYVVGWGFNERPASD